MIDVAPSTIVVYSDIGCPWAHLAVFRLHRARAKLGLASEIRFDHRAFPLEIFNEQPTPKKTLDAEISVAGGLDPDARWQMWQRPEFEYPVTMLPALEAVQATKEQSLASSEALDLALRVAFFGSSETVSMRHVILAIANDCPSVDADRLAVALDRGVARAAVMEQKRAAESDEVQGSPHLFFADGSDAHNPGIEMEWAGDHGAGGPVIDEDHPEIYLDLLQRAAGKNQ
jgi:predicted DsbA family dithiol-disulfide isomerase